MGFDLLPMVRNHFLLKEAAGGLSEDIMLLAEDPAGSDVHHCLGAGDFWTGRHGGLLQMIGMTVLQPVRKHRILIGIF